MSLLKKILRCKSLTAFLILFYIFEENLEGNIVLMSLSRVKKPNIIHFHHSFTQSGGTSVSSGICISSSLTKALFGAPSER